MLNLLKKEVSQERKIKAISAKETITITDTENFKMVIVIFFLISDTLSIVRLSVILAVFQKVVVLDM